MNERDKKARKGGREKKRSAKGALSLASGTEARILQSISPSGGDVLKQGGAILADTLRIILGTETDVRLSSGEEVKAPLITQVLVKKIDYWLKNPENINLRELSYALGEQKQSMEGIDMQSAANLFRGIAVDVEVVERKPKEIGSKDGNSSA